MKLHCDSCNKEYPEEYYIQSFLDKSLHYGWTYDSAPYSHHFNKALPDFGDSRGWREFSLNISGIPWTVKCSVCAGGEIRHRL